MKSLPLALGTLLAVACLLGLSASASAGPPPGFADTLVATGLTRPTAMAWDPNGRLFVTLQDGALRVIKNGVLLPTPFVNLSVDSNGERGLLGIAFDPQFTQNHFVYVYYTVPGPTSHNRVSRFTDGGDIAVPGSEVDLLDLPDLDPAKTNHNGGAIHFGKDGKLYIGVGENDHTANSQDLSTPLGKVLRINSDGTIPSDNPFVATPGASPLVWAYGFRNPFTFGVQPKTGRIFIDDVGSDLYEEINDLGAGANYGWPLAQGPSSQLGLTNPIFAYRHDAPGTDGGCAITGGTFYNPPVPYLGAGYVGTYFFSDLCTGAIRVFDPSTSSVALFSTGASQPVDLETGRDGSLYYLQRNGSGPGSVHRVSRQAMPTISSIRPASGTAGTRDFDITGTHLADATSVTVNGKAAQFAVVWDTWVHAVVPKGATSGPVQLTNGSGTATAPQNFDVTLTITAFGPSPRPVGAAVKVIGDGFASATSVRFNGVAAAFTIESPQRIRATIPPGATTGPITVVTPSGKTSSADPYPVSP